MASTIGPLIMTFNLPRSLSSPSSPTSVTVSSHVAASSPPLLLRSIPAVICNAADEFVNRFLDPPPAPFVDPRRVLAGNFAPVPELPPTECTVTAGGIPECLNGIYLRNGPNPRHVPRSSYHHFDGDGMLHVLSVQNGSATFCSRYVRTNKFLVEESCGRPVVPNGFSGLTGRAGVARITVTVARSLLGIFDPTKGFGTANTSVLCFNSALMALSESDAPYVLRLTGDGDIQTIDRYDFDGKLPMGMTAHPKIDADTGELFAYCYSPFPPFLNFFRVSAAGEKSPDVGIHSISQPSFIHDFAITKKYAVFPDTQIVLNPANMLSGSGSIFCYDADKVPRIGIIPRYATDDAEMKWLPVPGFNFIHALNAWDDGDDEVTVVAVNPEPLEEALRMSDAVRPRIEKIRINLKSGGVQRERICNESLEMGVINHRFVGRRNRFAYMAKGAPFPKISGVAKFDLQEEGIAAERDFGEGVYGGEPFFVPRSTAPDAAEDDGYVVMYGHDEGRRVSMFLVMDAASKDLEVVASVELPARVPYGFHGLFVAERELRRQRL
eukprot:TRINITY_DN705_c0_g2_i1.p1 TRINITY_DN705_c0_g2~~TRINITY_DN705_c0_g2_i1.p1  ORF type:complete len:617 (+),score=-56.71 TRINITY_DN705_c0_g2_i1:198-1853(+)